MDIFMEKTLSIQESLSNLPMYPVEGAANAGKI